ncbi:hypothetical protein TRAPUB_13352 [Trametes pubescens]|uniref:Uncharacterized protein n=1 Tax=Trametes pubescens TaxID=154538 RepID=A0A1M2W7V5_TRAPU|nr:hypothetical protein TRAPUB_13352 [Trametes pubescens]
MSDLPPPPVPRSPYRDHDLSPLAFRNSSSSSLSLSFAPSVDGFHGMGIDNGDAISQLMNDTYDLGPFEMRDPDHKGKRRSHRDTFVLDGDLSPIAPGDSGLPSPLGKFPPVPAFIHGVEFGGSKAGKLLRKMSSQQNLPSQRHSATSVASSASHDDMTIHNPHPLAKPARKQRSFHAARVPMPPIPGFRNGSSSAQPSSSLETIPAPSSPIIEPRRSSVTSPRKRLFSGSSARRSTSSHGPTPSTEDDSRSVFSLDTDSRPGTGSVATDHITLSFGAAGGPLSLMTRNACISPESLWEDAPVGASAGGEDRTKRTSQSEYVPQYIMSPAEQLKLAEKLADEEASARAARAEPEPESERKPKLDLHPGDFGLAFRQGKNASQVPVMNTQRERDREREAAQRSRSNSVLSHASTGTLAFGSSGHSNGHGLGGGEPAGVSRGVSMHSTKSASSGWQGSSARPALHTATSAPPPRKMSLVEGSRGPARSASMLARNLTKPPSISARPATAQPGLSPPTSPTRFGPPKDSPEIAPASLPPPPRRRPSRHELQELEIVNKRVSVVPINPLSPPPMRPRPRRQQSSDTGISEVSSRPPSAFDRQKALQRRSIMKKPSFLEIDDEFEAGAENDEDDGETESMGRDTTPPSPQSPAMESSFLDMDRKDSFDTVRSEQSAYYVY